MTTEMIIEKIEKIRDKTYLTHSEHEALDMAIEALEKQMPKKPIIHHFYENETDYSYYTCASRCDPYCQVNTQDGFCKKCGQRIDWSNEE